MPEAVRVLVEAGSKRVLAAALDWPGWVRAGKDEARAMEALAAYAGRYSAVARQAGIAFDVGAYEVVERVNGNAMVDFGVPSAVTAGDRAGSAGARQRAGKLVAAGWEVLDRIAAKAPAELRKGPRGGGRDRDAILEHVLNAEGAYARKLGRKIEGAAPGDGDGIREHRRAILELLLHPVPDAAWPPLYGSRRIAWHALDHAWEIEDRG